jgi:hypothetical protein
LDNLKEGQIKILVDEQLIKKWNQENPFRQVGIWGKTPWHVVMNHLVKFPNGNMDTYLSVELQQRLKGEIAGTVSLPILPDGRVLLVFNDQVGLIESIRGFATGKEPAREVLDRKVEKTGAKIIKSTSGYLGKYRSDSVLTTGNVSIYSVSIDEYGRFQGVGSEEGRTHLFAFTRHELDKAIERGYVWVKISGQVKRVEIGSDGFLLAALYLYDRHHPRVKTELPPGAFVQGSNSTLHMKPFMDG